jgi:hypothetical protein
MLFSRGPLCDNAALLPYCPNQCDRPFRKFAAGTPCNPVPLIQGNWVSILRDCSQGSEASFTAAATDSRLLIVAKFLESGIATQRIP